MNRLRISTKRALSGPITSAILLAAVATMGVFLVGWSNTTLTLNQAELETTFSNKINKLSEDVMIENVWFGTDTGGTKFVNITLSNIGTLGITLTQIELVNSTDTHTITITSGDLLPDQTYSLEENYVWTSDTATDVTVTTARTNYFTTQVTP